MMPWAAVYGELSQGALPDIPQRMIDNGKFNNVPLLIGTNANESNGLLFFLPERIEPFFDLELDLFYRNATLIAQMKALYNWSNPESKQRDKFEKIMTDYIFTCPSRRAARGNGRKSVSFQYDWNYRSGLEELFVGVGHGFEVVFVFQHPFDFGEITPKDFAMAKLMQHYWVNFITKWEPNSASKPTYPTWLPSQTNLSYLEIGEPETTHMDTNLHGPHCDFWDRYAATYI